MGEFQYDKSRITSKLDQVGIKRYAELQGEERVMEAIRSQPQEVRDRLLDAWETYKGMTQKGQGGILGVPERNFFDEILAEENTVPPDFEGLVRGANFPSNKGRNTEPIKGVDTMAESPVDLNRNQYNVVIREPGELTEEK